MTVTAYDANGDPLQAIGPAYRGGTPGTVMIEDAFRSGLTSTQTGDLALNNACDGFDRVIQATDALGNYVDTGAGYTTDPFLDPDGRVIRSDNYGTLGDGTTGIHLHASAKMQFDEAGRQYEIEREVFFAALPSGRNVTHYGGGLVPNSTAIRELYRLRFGIEASFRQMRQARIYTCTRNSRLRLFFLAVALILRNLWVWIHHTLLAEGSGDTMILHLELLRFNRMLEWVVREIVALFHDGSIPYVVQPP